jgi:hypothetical protein
MMEPAYQAARARSEPRHGPAAHDQAACDVMSARIGSSGSATLNRAALEAGAQRTALPRRWGQASVLRTGGYSQDEIAACAAAKLSGRARLLKTAEFSGKTHNNFSCYN